MQDAPLNPTEEQQLEMRTKPLEGWDREFVDVALAQLFEMILAANFLDLKPMLDITCKAVAEMIKGKTPDEIKAVFGVEGDFTEEEKQQVLRDNPWYVCSTAPCLDFPGNLSLSCARHIFICALGMAAKRFRSAVKGLVGSTQPSIPQRLQGSHSPP